MLEYPAQSPDLNPIENLWSHLTRKIRECKLSNLEELEVSGKEEWRKIPEDVCSNLIRNYSKRLHAVLKNKGYTIDC